MNSETREALEGSIKKWQGIVDGTVLNAGSTNCPLCVMFLNMNDCSGCPVYEKTGKNSCHGSPYHRFVDHSASYPGEDDKGFDAWQTESTRLAQAELDFLISLRED